MIYIFDIDGTLTPFRSPIVSEFKEWFLNWSKDKRIWFATGSDLEKTLEQLGSEFYSIAERSYQSNGQEIYSYGKLIQEAPKFDIGPKCFADLDKFLTESEYPVRAGNHFEPRPGALNFSIVGRNCSKEQRSDYATYDLQNFERQHIVEVMSEKYPEIEFALGGEISIDIYPKGSGKGNLIKDLDDNFTFFGDHMYPGGNDYSVYERAKEVHIADDNTFHNVESYEQTWEILRGIK